MVLMKLKTLQSTLENVESFKNPKLHLEQYLTSPHIAGHMLYCIEMEYGDIEGKSVVDLGCGTGMLCIGASLLGASYCLGVDIDEDALEICRENIEDCQLRKIDLLKMNVLQQHVSSQLEDKQQSHSLHESSNKIKEFNLTLGKKFDTVIMNPPFGTKKVKNIDIDFVKFGLSVCTGAVYSLHKTTHFQTIKRELNKLDIEVKQMTQITFDLPRSYKNHRQDSADVSVQMLRFCRRGKKDD